MEAPLDILQQYWGYAAFRPLQEDIVDSVLAGRDTLALSGASLRLDLTAQSDNRIQGIEQIELTGRRSTLGIVQGGIGMGAGMGGQGDRVDVYRTTRPDRKMRALRVGSVPWKYGGMCVYGR